MSRLVVIFILIWTPIISFANQGLVHKYFYVAPTGKTPNSGTIDAPYTSFEEVQRSVRAFKSRYPETPVTVIFRGGRYYRTQSIIFTAEDSGTKNGPVTYQAYPGEKPVIMGGKQLELEWVPFRDGIYKAQVPEGLIFESLFINDQEQILARYPNYNPDIRIFNGTADDCISKGKVESWADPEYGYFHVIHKAMWGAFHYQITGKKNKGELEMTGGWQNNRPENGIHEKLRYVENIFEELDAEKEWYLDRKSSVLYFKPEVGTDLNTARVEVAYLENFVSITGTEANPVRYLSLDGFHFNRSVRTFMKSSERLLRSDWAIFRGGSVYLEGTEHCSIINCEFSQIGGNAVFFNAYNLSSSVEGCHMHNIGANGVCFVGDTSAVRNPKFIPYGPPVSDEELDLVPGPKNKRYPSNCLVHNNLIHDFGKVEKQVAGVQISMAAFVTVSHNSIYDCPRAGINVSEGAFGGHIIEWNDVFNTVLETSDHGSFNSWGRDRFWMVRNDKTEKRVEADRSLIFLDILAPTIIRNNRWRCDHGWDIDLDDGSSYYYLYNNLCLKNGIKLREGYHRRVENNICINNSIHPHVWLKNSGDIIRGNILGTSFFPIRVQYWGTEIDYNWFSGEEALLTNQDLGIDKNSKFGDPMFQDPANGDFSIKPQSKVMDLGWKNFPMDRFGVKKAELKAIAKEPEIILPAGLSLNQDVVYDFFGGKIKNLLSDGDVSATGMHAKTGAMVIQVPLFGSVVDFRLEEGDVLLKINELEVKSAEELLSKQSLFDQGKVKSLTVWRDQSLVILK